MLHRNSGPLHYREQQSVRNAHASQEFWGHFSTENNNLSGMHMLHRNSGPLQYREQQSVRNAHASQEFWATSVQRTTICQERTCVTEILGHYSIENNNLSGTHMLHTEFWGHGSIRTTICQKHIFFAGILEPFQFREQQSVRNYTHVSHHGHYLFIMGITSSSWALPRFGIRLLSLSVKLTRTASILDTMRLTPSPFWLLTHP